MQRDNRVLEERGLRAAVLAGDATAWQVLYDRHFRALYGYVYWRAGRHPQRAEDVVQECWVVAVRRIRRFDPERASFQTWLWGVADNVLRNHRRRWFRRDQTELPGAACPKPEGAVESPQIGAAPNRGVELAEQIGLALTALPSRYQAAIRAKYDEGASVAEIAERWGETPKAVESLLTRARAAFRAEYKRLEGTT